MILRFIVSKKIQRQIKKCSYKECRDYKKTKCFGQPGKSNCRLPTEHAITHNSIHNNTHHKAHCQKTANKKASPKSKAFLAY